MYYVFNQAQLDAELQKRCKDTAEWTSMQDLLRSLDIVHQCLGQFTQEFEVEPGDQPVAVHRPDRPLSVSDEPWCQCSLVVGTHYTSQHPEQGETVEIPLGFPEPPKKARPPRCPICGSGDAAIRREVRVGFQGDGVACANVWHID